MQKIEHFIKKGGEKSHPKGFMIIVFYILNGKRKVFNRGAEKGNISLLSSLEKSISEISRKIGRSRNVVSRYLTFGKKKRVGRPRKLSFRTIGLR